jgi:hypothetical protein
MPRPAPLPSDVESLQRLVREQQAQLLSRDVLIEQLKLQLARLKRMKFGQSSEQLDAQIAQLELSLEELEANAAATIPAKALSQEPVTRPARKPLPEHRPREPHVHEPATGSCQCPECGGMLRRLGEDTSEVLEYVPEHWKVIRHVRPKYSCGSCQQIVQADAPSRPIGSTSGCWIQRSNPPPATKFGRSILSTRESAKSVTLCGSGTALHSPSLQRRSS